MRLGSGDQSFGGTGIVGVAPVLKKQSLMIYEKQDHYNKWEFVYNPLTDIQTMGGGMMGTAPGGMPGQNGAGFGSTGAGMTNGIGGGGIGGPGIGGATSPGGGPGASGGFGGSGFGGGGFGGSGFGGGGIGGNGPGGSSPTPQPQQQSTPQEQQ